MLGAAVEGDRAARRVISSRDWTGSSHDCCLAGGGWIDFAASCPRRPPTRSAAVHINAAPSARADPSPDAPSAWDERLRPAAWVAGIWILAAVLGASLEMPGRPVPGMPAFSGSLVDWLACAAFLPVAVWLVRRVPLTRRGWMRAVPAYAAAAAGMVALKQALGAATGERVWFDAVALAAMFGIVLALRHHRTLRERESRAARLEAALAHAQLDALRSRIRPHFLFNTMNAISTLIHCEPRAADEMLTRLCDLLRDSLDADGAQEVPLRHELRVLDRYLDIMRLRFPDRLAVDVRVDDDVLDERVPHFILQPLAEDAIEHGVARAARGGRIVVAAARAGGGVRITVADEGPAAVREQTGLSITRERLWQLYGPDAALRLHGSPGGTEVELRIPSARSVEAAAR